MQEIIDVVQEIRDSCRFTPGSDDTTDYHTAISQNNHALAAYLIRNQNPASWWVLDRWSVEAWLRLDDNQRQHHDSSGISLYANPEKTIGLMRFLWGDVLVVLESADNAIWYHSVEPLSEANILSCQNRYGVERGLTQDSITVSSSGRTHGECLLIMQVALQKEVVYVDN